MSQISTSTLTNIPLRDSNYGVLEPMSDRYGRRGPVDTYMLMARNILPPSFLPLVFTSSTPEWKMWAILRVSCCTRWALDTSAATLVSLQCILQTATGNNIC